MDIYQEHIIFHYKNPQNWGVLENPTVSITGNNPLCGDEIRMQLCIVDGILKEIKWKSLGCAISTASASLVSEHVKGKKLTDIKRLTREDILSLLSIELTPARLQCGLLARDTLKEGIKQYERS